MDLPSIGDIDNNKYFVAIGALFVLLGSRVLAMELYEECSVILNHHMSKKIILLFALFFYTRSIKHAIIVSVFVYLLFPKVFFKTDTTCDTDNNN